MGLTSPYCGSKDTIKRAWRKTKFGKKQRETEEERIVEEGMG